jgi:ABC-type nitrate/sulfonate/bicarbonate transport system permease component
MTMADRPAAEAPAGSVPPVWSRRPGWRRLAWGLAPALTFIALIGLWALLVSAFQIPDYLVPVPQSVIPRLLQARQALWANTVITLREIVLGFVITVVLSIPLGLLIALRDLFPATGPRYTPSGPECVGASPPRR